MQSCRSAEARNNKTNKTNKTNTAGGRNPINKTKERKPETMNSELADAIVTCTILAVPIGSYVLGLGYMLWKGL